ncbi:MAG: TIGR03618 family F420-dependent PPOX class oxidoreductase [Actinomycetota bacterium]|jgi:PPOX class probable F420-dependent enzyme|nr:TIGR03618 family F420-dependent PPOX class oxidoreductase [Actinomycetota bacterium]
MGVVDEEVLELAKGTNFASFSTILPGGRPVGSLVWVDADADRLLVNTERHRLKYRNVCRNPSVHLLIVDHEDPGHYASVQGQVDEHVFGRDAREHIDRLARKYLGTPFDPARIVSERVLLRIRPVHQRIRSSSVMVE